MKLVHDVGAHSVLSTGCQWAGASVRPRDWPGDLGLPVIVVVGETRADQVVLANGLLDLQVVLGQVSAQRGVGAIEVVVSAVIDSNEERGCGSGRRTGASGNSDLVRDWDEHHDLAVCLLEHFLRVQGAAVPGWPQASRCQRADQLVKGRGPPRDQGIEAHDRGY